MTKLVIVIFFWHAAHVHVAAHVPVVHFQNVYVRSCSSYVQVHGHVNLFFLSTGGIEKFRKFATC
jgi:hypothetical protein